MDLTQLQSGFLKLIHSRKSVRHYSPETVSREVVETLVRAGMAAPSAVNRQPWAFVAVDDRALLNELGKKLPYARMLLLAPAAIVVCGDMEKALNEWQQAYWIQDCSAATQNILLAAEALGLGAVWTAVYPSEERIAIVRKSLNLPDYLMPLNVIPFGYPDGNDQPREKWNPSNLRWNKWI